MSVIGAAAAIVVAIFLGIAVFQALKVVHSPIYECTDDFVRKIDRICTRIGNDGFRKMKTQCFDPHFSNFTDSIRNTTGPCFEVLFSKVDPCTTDNMAELKACMRQGLKKSYKEIMNESKANPDKTVGTCKVINSCVGNILLDHEKELRVERLKTGRPSFSESPQNVCAYRFHRKIHTGCRNYGGSYIKRLIGDCVKPNMDNFTSAMQVVTHSFVDPLFSEADPCSKDSLHKARKHILKNFAKLYKDYRDSLGSKMINPMMACDKVQDCEEGLQTEFIRSSHYQCTEEFGDKIEIACKKLKGKSFNKMKSECIDTNVHNFTMTMQHITRPCLVSFETTEDPCNPESIIEFKHCVKHRFEIRTNKVKLYKEFSESKGQRISSCDYIDECVEKSINGIAPITTDG